MATPENTPRLTIPEVDPQAYTPLYALEKHLRAGSLGENLLALVKMRASQLNGCAYCLNMHPREARKAEVSQQKLDVLAGWHEAPDLYTDRERAALRLTEQVTLIAGGVSEEVWEAAAAVFSEQERAELLMAIAAINTWNRLAIATRQQLD